MNARIAAALFALAAIPVAAQTATPQVDQRQFNQEARIQQGVQSGALTNKEAAKLEKGQDKIQAQKVKAKADGVVTAKERRHMHRMQDRASKNIHHQKHDAQVAAKP